MQLQDQDASFRLVTARDDRAGGVPIRAGSPRHPRASDAAPSLDAADPRWLLARRAAELLQGGQAAILPPECRSRLLDLGRRLGLRTFDSSLVIAIVQDDARRSGQDGPAEMVRRLKMVPSDAAAGDATHQSSHALLGWFVATGLIAAAMALGAGWWLVH